MASPSALQVCGYLLSQEEYFWQGPRLTELNSLLVFFREHVSFLY